MSTPSEFEPAKTRAAQEAAGNGQAPLGHTVVTGPVADPDARAERLEGPGQGSGRKADAPPQARPSLRDAVKLGVLGLAITLVGAAVGMIVAAFLPATYATRTQLIYWISAEQPTAFLREDRSLTTQALLLKSRMVLEPVALANGLRVEQLTEQVDANVVEGSLLIDVEVRDGDRATGLRLAQAINNRYLETVRPSDQPELRQYFEDQLKDIQQRLRELPPNAAERPQLAVREVDVQRQLDDIRLGVAQESRADVVVPPYSIESPVSPRPMLAVATGTLSGLMIALVVISVLVRLRSRGGR